MKPRPRNVVPGDMDPIMLPANGPIFRGVMTWSEQFDEQDYRDVIEDNIRMFGGNSRNIVAARGARSTQGQQDLVESTKADFDASNKFNKGLPPISEPKTPNRAMTAAAAPLKSDEGLNNSSLPDQHPPKFINQALRDYAASRPPFVRQFKKEDFLSTKRVTLATHDGKFPQTVIPATLMTRKWDSKSSYHTLDRNGERLIVKAFGNPHGVRYRAWSGQGKWYQNPPVAFGLKDDLEDQNSSGMESDDDVESNPEVIVEHGLKDFENEDYFLYSSRESSSSDDSQQDSSLQATTKEPNITDTLATRAPLTDLDASHDDAAGGGLGVGPNIEPESTHQASLPPSSPSPPEPSTVAPKGSEIAVEKRQASETFENNRPPKRSRSQQDNTILQSTTIARVPQSLTEYKQERTVLFVPRRGSKSDMIPIKLISATTIPSFFSSVCAAAGIVDGEDLGIAVMLKPWDNGMERNIILRRDTIQAFEYFLEIIDEAECWKEEGGRLSFWLQLKWLLGP